MIHAKFKFGLLLILAAVCTAVLGQATYQLGEGSRIWVEGTSTLRNWKAEVGTFTGSITTDAAGEVVTVSLSLDVKSMDGGRGPDMNTKIFKALLSDQHPQITFTGKKAAAQSGDISTYGTLSLAGLKKEVQVSATGSLSSGHLTGQHKLKFSDFKIDPPSALFGQIVCYDDIVIMFDLNLVK